MTADERKAVFEAQRQAAGIPVAVFNLCTVISNLTEDNIQLADDKVKLREQITTLQALLKEARAELALLKGEASGPADNQG